MKNQYKFYPGKFNVRQLDLFYVGYKKKVVSALDQAKRRVRKIQKKNNDRK